MAHSLSLVTFTAPAVQRRSNAPHRHSAKGLADAHEHSIDLAIEPLRPVHTDIINTLPQALEIVTAVDDPRCGVCMETFQVWRGDEEGEQVLHEIREAGPDTQIVQVADSRVEPRSKEDRLVPGEGALPLAEMLGCLFSTGYDGWLAVGNRCRPNYGRSTTTCY